MYTKQQYVLGLLRIALGWIFLWAFVDKVWGLGYATKPVDAWISGGSPTTGFLKFGTHGPFASFFQSLAGNSLVDCVFMVGLLGIGLALVFGIASRMAYGAGMVLMVLMWLAVVPPEHNPFIDEHVIYFFVLWVLKSSGAERYLGMAERWSRSAIARKLPILK